MKKIFFSLLLYYYSYGQNFISNANTVIDVDTAMIWERSGKYKKTWVEALNYCNGTVQGTEGWHLPNTNELQTIIDYTRNRPAINKNYFTDFTSKRQYYWTSSVSIENSNKKAYCARIGIEGKFSNCSRDDDHYVICVKKR
jgi:hypothetical protein